MEKLCVDQTVVKQSLFYWILFYLIHALWSLAEKFYDVIKFNYRTLSFFMYKYSTKDSTNSAQIMLKTRKIPNHLTIIIGDETPSFQDLANFVIWSLFTGIPFISFLDPKGTLKQKEDYFKEVVCKMVKEGENILWHDSSSSSFKNGLVGRKIHVKIFTPNDGKPILVEVAKEFCEKNDQIDIQSVDNLVKKYFEFPDPDLAIYCGKRCTTWDYPPWQLRLTEFLNLDTHYTLTPNKFIRLLYRYNQCEQRLGK